MTIHERILQAIEMAKTGTKKDERLTEGIEALLRDGELMVSAAIHGMVNGMHEWGELGISAGVHRRWRGTDVCDKNISTAYIEDMDGNPTYMLTKFTMSRASLKNIAALTGLNTYRRRFIGLIDDGYVLHTKLRFMRVAQMEYKLVDPVKLTDLPKKRVKEIRDFCSAAKNGLDDSLWQDMALDWYKEHLATEYERQRAWIHRMSRGEIFNCLPLAMMDNLMEELGYA